MDHGNGGYVHRCNTTSLFPDIASDRFAFMILHARESGIWKRVKIIFLQQGKIDQVVRAVDYLGGGIIKLDEVTGFWLFRVPGRLRRFCGGRVAGSPVLGMLR